MEQFVLQLGMMSLQASIVIGVVLLVRLLFMQMRVAKKYMCILWILPYLCMVCPWKIEADFGFWRIPETVEVAQMQEGLEDWIAEKVQMSETEGNLPQKDGNTENTISIGAIQNSDIVTEGTTDNVVRPVTEYVIGTFFGIWLIGFLSILAYSLVSFWKLKSKLVCSICMSENIYIADDIQIPFVLGIFKSRIYLPSGLPQENLTYVLAHEKTHIRRGDPLKKILSLGISALHWFNPLSWVAFHFMEKDMEMACDEETISKLGLEYRKNYAEALLVLSSGKKLFLGVPLAFDEGNVKGRICNILKYKKAWHIVTGAAVLVIAVLTVCFMTKSKNGEEAEVIGETYCLSEYRTDLTGDRVEERIIFEVDGNAVANMTNEEILARVWSGKLSMQVRILEGRRESENEDITESKLLWMSNYSGKAGEKGNLAVCKYIADTYLLRYSNDVSNGKGRFWYEVLSFEKGEAVVYDGAEAVYDVVNLQEMEGQELTAEYIAMVEQVKSVEKGLQRYLNANWAGNILLNVVSKPEDCYLYQGENISWGNAYESFAAQAVGTGFELRIEDFFYPQEGNTVLPEDARERVLAGELLYMEVTEENATAGKLDLDGDGEDELICLESLEWNDKYDYGMMFRADYRLRVNNVYYEGHGQSLDAQVILYSPDGKMILLALYDDGPSGDPSTIFYQYDSENKQMLLAGEIPTDLRRATIENGVVKGSFRADMIETQFAVGYWIWNGTNMVLREDETYEFGLYNTRYGENGEVWEDGYMRLKENLTVYTERNEGSKALTMVPQKVLCVRSDLKEWIYLVAEDGTEGWLRVEFAKIPSLGNKASREVFDGLGFAG